MKVILDENLPPRWNGFLSAHDVESKHWTEIGSAGDPDQVIFDYALSTGAIIITQDLDFTRLLARQGSRLPSVIQLRVSCPIPETVGVALVKVLNEYTRQLSKGCLISLDLNRHRLRLLPLC